MVVWETSNGEMGRMSLNAFFNLYMLFVCQSRCPSKGEATMNNIMNSRDKEV
jgi:hypothetical protein